MRYEPEVESTTLFFLSVSVRDPLEMEVVRKGSEGARGGGGEFGHARSLWKWEGKKRGRGEEKKEGEDGNRKRERRTKEKNKIRKRWRGGCDGGTLSSASMSMASRTGRRGMAKIWLRMCSLYARMNETNALCAESKRARSTRVARRRERVRKGGWEKKKEEKESEEA